MGGNNYPSTEQTNVEVPQTNVEESTTNETTQPVQPETKVDETVVEVTA